MKWGRAFAWILVVVCLLSWLYQLATQHNAVLGVTSFVAALYAIHILIKTGR